MKSLKKYKIIKNLTDKKIYDIKYEFAVEATKDIVFDRCYKYSAYHYKTIYTILKHKLDTITDKDEKIAYINCLSVNYSSLGKTDVYDILISFLLGDFLGISIIKDSEGLLTKMLVVLFTIAFWLIKSYAATTKKWEFYSDIFNHLKNKI